MAPPNPTRPPRGRGIGRSSGRGAGRASARGGGNSSSNQGQTVPQDAPSSSSSSSIRGRGRAQGTRGRGRGRHIPGERSPNAAAGTNPSTNSTARGAGDSSSHAVASSSSSSRGRSRTHTTVTSASSGSSSSSSSAAHMSTAQLRDLFRSLLKKLTSSHPRRPDDLACFLDTAWQLLQQDGEEDSVLQALADRGTSSSGGTSGSSGTSGNGGLLLLQQVAQSTASGADCKLVTAVGSMQQASNALPFLQCVVPLMRLLGDQQVKTSTLHQHTNPIYATMYSCLDHTRVARVLAGLAAQQGPGSPFANSQAAGSVTGLRRPWQPSSWLDVLESLVGYLMELPRRFRQQDTWIDHRAGIQSLYAAVEAAFKHQVKPEAGAGNVARVKRLSNSIRMLAQPLGHFQQQAAQLTEQQRRTQIRAQMAAGGAAPIMLQQDPPR